MLKFKLYLLWALVIYFIALKKITCLNNCKTRRDNEFYLTLNGIYLNITTSISRNYISFNMNISCYRVMFIICRFKYRKKETFKARVLSAVDCWAKLYLKFALKTPSFGDVAFTRDFFVTFTFFREEKKPDHFRLLK